MVNIVMFHVGRRGAIRMLNVFFLQLFFVMRVFHRYISILNLLVSNQFSQYTVRSLWLWFNDKCFSNIKSVIINWNTNILYYIIFRISVFQNAAVARYFFIHLGNFNIRKQHADEREELHNTYQIYVYFI